MIQAISLKAVIMAYQRKHSAGKLRLALNL